MKYLEAIQRLQSSPVAITNQRIALLTNKTVRAVLVWKNQHRAALRSVIFVDGVTLRRRHQIQRLLWQAHMRTRAGSAYVRPCILTLQEGLGVSRSTVGRLLRKEPHLRTLLRIEKA